MQRNLSTFNTRKRQPLGALSTNLRLLPSTNSTALTLSATIPAYLILLEKYGLPDDDNEAVYPWLQRKYLEDEISDPVTSLNSHSSIVKYDDEDVYPWLQKRYLEDAKSLASKDEARPTSKKRAVVDESNLDGITKTVAGNTRPKRSRTSAVSYTVPDYDFLEETPDEYEQARRCYEIDDTSDVDEDFHIDDSSCLSAEEDEANPEHLEDDHDEDSDTSLKSFTSILKEPSSRQRRAPELSLASLTTTPKEPSARQRRAPDQSLESLITTPKEPSARQRRAPDLIDEEDPAITHGSKRRRKVVPVKHAGVALHSNGKPSTQKNRRAADPPASYPFTGVPAFTRTVIPETEVFDELRAFQDSLSQAKVVQWRRRDPVESIGIMDLLTNPKVRDCTLRGVKYQSLSKRCDQAHWWVKVSEHNKARYHKDSIKFIFHHPRFNEAQVQATVPVLKELIDRWPFDIAWDTPDRQLQTWRAAFTNAASELAQKELSEKVEFHAHTVGWYQDKYHIDIPFFDLEDGSPQLFEENISPSYITNLSIPDVPEHYRFEYNPNKKPLNQRVDLGPANVSESSADMARHAVAKKLCQAVYSKLYGKFASKSTMIALASVEVARLGISRRHKKNGSYGGVRLYMVSLVRRMKEVCFKPSTWFDRDVDGYVPPITLRSLQSVQVSQVMAAIDEGWASSGNPLVAWEAGAIEAFMLNEKLLNDGLAPYCKCTEEEANTTVHVCQQCRRMTVCSTLLIDDCGNMVCTECYDEQQKDTQFARFLKGRQKTAKPDVSDGEYLACRKFIKLQYQECRDLHIEKPTNSDLAEIWESFRNKHGVLQDGEFMMRDVLTSVPRHMFHVRMNGISKRTHPFSGSYDALFPYTVYQGRLRYHAPDNMIPVPLHINLLKGVFIPAMLQILVDYRRELMKDTDKFVRDMDGIQMIALQIAHRKKFRLRNVDGLTESELNARMAVDKQEWVSGKPRRFSRDVQATIDKLSRICTWKGESETDRSWRVEDIRRMERIIVQVESRFGRKVARAQADKAPYPFHESSMPSHWCWAVLCKVFETRLSRMTFKCNRKWATVDTPETLLLECIIQHLDPDHEEFLGLPLVPFYKHPLRFSVAHRHHGTQMRTGFKNPHPTSLDDYEPNLNNILFETWASNSMKSDFDESLYDGMLTELAAVKISREWYDPDLARVGRSEDDRELPRNLEEWELEDIEAADEYEGEFDSVE